MSDYKPDAARILFDTATKLATLSMGDVREVAEAFDVVPRQLIKAVGTIVNLLDIMEETPAPPNPIPETPT